MRGFAVVALDDSKSGTNLGGAIRAARCFGAAFVVATGRVAKINHPAAVKGHRHVPVIWAENVTDSVPFGCETVVVDRVEGAECLSGFIHPERAYYIFGGEDRTLSDELVRECDHCVEIPAGCLNLAAAVNVVLYDRAAKYARGEATEGS